MTTFFLKKPQALIGAVATLLTVVFVGLVIGPVFLSAQNPVTEGEDNWNEDATRTYSETGYNFNNTEQASQNPLPSDAAKNAAKLAADNVNVQAGSIDSCVIAHPLVGTLAGCAAWVADQAMWLSARTLWISGVLLNITLSTTLNLNDLLTRLPVVDIGWKVLRDLANIVFIFIALWAGISITLGIGDNGKKAWGLLAEMVLVALFINFSLFITKAVVDASNVASLHFYSLIVEPGKEGDYDKGLSEAFLYGLNLSTLYNSKQMGSGQLDNASMISTVGKTAGKTLSSANIILIGFFGSLFIIVAAWVFFAAAIMFIYRAVTLMMLMMLSPLAFVGLILPGASGMAHAWWSKLWSQAFFAPLYLALAYVVVRTINADGFRAGLAGLTTGDGMSFAAALTGTGANTVAVIFNFIMLIGLMVGCLVVAQSLGAKGSEMAMSGFEKIKGGAIGVVGATTRGVIKAPSALGKYVVGNTGKAMSGVGNWMNTKFSNKWVKSTGEKLFYKGEEFHEGVGAKIRTKSEWLDPRYWEERADQSKWGNTMVGKAVRQVTTGAIANTPIGRQSLTEAYHEGEEMESKRRERGYGDIAEQNARRLEDLHHKEQHTLEEILNAEREVRDAEKELQEAIKSGDAAKKDAAEKTLGKGFMNAQEGLKKAEKELKEAEEATTRDPARIAAAQAAVVVAKTNVGTEKARGGLAVTLAEAQEEAETFRKTTRKDREQYTNAIKDAIAQMSTEAFLNLPKVFFENSALMDLSVLGQDKFSALMKSEHFTKTEKEEYTHARWKRTEELAKRRQIRTEWHLEELPEHQRQVQEYQGKLDALPSSLRLKQLEDDYTAQVRSLSDELRDLEQELADAEHDSTKSKSDIEKKRNEVEAKNKEIENAEYSYGKEKSEKIKNRDAEIKSEQKAGRLAPPPEMREYELGWGEADDIRKALRNILRGDEVVNLYRYNRKAFGMATIADTIKQGTWNKVRESGEVDSNSIEQVARVLKRHYIKDSIYLGSGLDAVQMHKMEEADLSGAHGLLKDLGSEMKKRGIQGYAEWIKTGGLQKFLEKEGRVNLSADISVQLDRHGAGLQMYKDVAPNLATNEFEMMPGMMREHAMSLNYYDQGSIVPFTHRDIENTLPIAEFYIEQFKRDIESGGRDKISDGNLRVLKWFVNENQGQGFTQFEQIRDDLKDSWEKIKRLIAGSARAARSQKYETVSAVLDDIQAKTGTRYEPFQRIRSAGDRGNQR